MLQGLEGKNDAGLPVTQSNDPRSGGHFALAMSKAPLGSAREGSRVVVFVVAALHVADSEDRRLSVTGESPISNGLTAVGGAKTRFLI
jgi:hypothetical protein